MEPKILSCPPRITPCFGAFSVFLSCKSSLLLKPKPQFASSQLSVSGHHLEKTCFLGKSLDFEVKIESLGGLRRTRLPTMSPIRATVKRRKEMPFDNVIQRDKKLKLVLTIRRLLMSQPDRIMSLRQLGRFRRALGLEKKKRIIVLLKNFPAVFKIVEEGAYSLKFTLTPEAERLYLEELQAKNEMEGLLVIKLRKLLMMSLDKRILLEKIAHLRTDLGLPLEFRDTICLRYPQYFKVLPTERGPALELTHWDPRLAVSKAERDEEENKKREREERDLIIDREPRFNRVKLPKGLNLSKREMKRMCQFRDMPYISPYSDFSMLRRGSPEKEKHACGVVHEILSLTVEKRTLVDHLTHFRDEFRFSQQLRGMLIRHPNMFYVSLKGSRDSVFLREAYHRSELIEKDRLSLIKEKMRSLVSIERRAWRNMNRHGNEPGEGEEKPGIDGFDEEEDEDEWSDDGGDDLPPDFNDDDDDDYENVENAKPIKKVDGPKKKKDKEVLVPVFADGSPRERW